MATLDLESGVAFDVENNVDIYTEAPVNATATPAATALAVTIPPAGAGGAGIVSAPVITRTLTLPAASAAGGTPGAGTPAAVVIATTLPASTLRFGFVTAPATIPLRAAVRPVRPEFVIGCAISIVLLEA